jgi:serine/threonine protein kinase
MTRLGKYEVLAELAKGSMGVLYRARDTVLDREVALKTIAGTGSLDPELKERFYREARSGAKLHHPNVITVYELGEHEGLVYIALELLSGCDLRQFIAQKTELPAEKKIAIMAAVCDGLHHAHQNGITHRDIKPSNIFLTDTQVPKILDFGVARLSTSKLTVVGRVLGTPYYMAPEQIMGQPCDARSDLFSLGIVTFEFLSFFHPFEGDSIPRRIINDHPDSILAHKPDLPAAMDAVLNRVLSRDPAARYQTAEDFGQALRETLRESRPAPEIRPPAAPRPAPHYANTEHKMSAVLMALQGFDDAIEQRNLAMARAALETVEQLAQIDDRFATAAKESRVRLQELEASLPPEPVSQPAPRTAEPVRRATGPPAPTTPPAPPRTPPPVEELRPASPIPTQPVTPPPSSRPPQPAPPPPARQNTPTRTMPSFPAMPPATVPPAAVPPATMPPSETAPHPAPADDVTSLFRASDAPARPPATPPPVARPPATPPPRSVAPHAPAPSLPPMAPPRTQPAAGSNRRTQPPVAARPQIAGIDRNVFIVGTAGAALIITAVVLWAVTRGSKESIVQAAGTAQVAAAQAPLRKEPSDSAELLATLKKGDIVNVIRPPRSRSQEWTEVQYVSPANVSSAGAMHTTDLTNWTSAKPDVAFYFLEMYAPGPGAGESELRQYAQNLTAFIQHFTGAPQINDAKAELDKTNAAIARVSAPAVSTAPHKPAAPPFDSEGELARAEKAWGSGDYTQAERMLRRILQQRPDFPAARGLLDKVVKAKQFESGK